MILQYLWIDLHQLEYKDIAIEILLACEESSVLQAN